VSTIQDAGRNPNKLEIKCPVTDVTQLEVVYKGSTVLQRVDDPFGIAVSFSMCFHLYGLKWNNAASI
jgi:hypothetical protein